MSSSMHGDLPGNRYASSLLLALLLATSAPAWAQTRDEVIRKAKAEGTVTYYTTLGITDARDLVDGFKKKHPYIDPQLVRLSGSRIINRVTVEANAGKNIADVVSTGELGIVELIDKNLVASYDSPERKKYDPRFKDTEGHWSVAFSNVAVTGYSTQQVDDAAVPQEWEDLLKPAWKGKMALDSEPYMWFAAVMEMLGEERGKRFMERLSRQDLAFRRGRTLQLQLLAAGEFAVGIEVHLRRLWELKNQGAPLDYAPIQPFLKPSVVMIMKNTPNPNAAKLFVDHMLSEEGQHALISPGIVSGNKQYKDRYARQYRKLDFHMPDFIRIGKHYDEIAAEFKKRFSP